MFCQVSTFKDFFGTEDEPRSFTPIIPVYVGTSAGWLIPDTLSITLILPDICVLPMVALVLIWIIGRLVLVSWAEEGMASTQATTAKKVDMERIMLRMYYL
jgi:hypothetical protein